MYFKNYNKHRRMLVDTASFIAPFFSEVTKFIIELKMSESEWSVVSVRDECCSRKYLFMLPMAERS
jgi:hypothetical protein